MAFGAYSKFLFCAVVAAVIYHISAASAIAKRNSQTVQLVSEEAGLYIAVSSTYSMYAEVDGNGKYKYIQYHAFQKMEVV